MVFATTWRGNARVLYFRHAPPPSPADFFRDEELPKEPFKGAPPYMRSVYYFWWAFLRENDGYCRYCETKQGAEFAGLYEDFRDVRDGDFMRWWDNRGRFIFCERLERNVRVHKADEDGRITDIRNPEEKIILSLPAHGDLRRMLAEVEELIIRERPDIEAKASWSDAKYQVTAKPVLSALHTRLTLWKLRKQHPEGSMPLHQLAQHAGLKFDFDSDRPDHRAQVVSRYLKETRCIIEHVGTGKFPITRPSQLEPKKLTKASGGQKGEDA